MATSLNLTFQNLYAVPRDPSKLLSSQIKDNGVDKGAIYLRRLDIGPYYGGQKDINITSLYSNTLDMGILLRYFDLYTKDDNDNITKVNDIIQQKLDDDKKRMLQMQSLPTNGGKRKTTRRRKNKRRSTRRH
jgi:hypothetical protein